MNNVVFGDIFPDEMYGAIMNYARITPPAPKTNYIEIPGTDSSIDLTEATGTVAYSDGEILFKFTLFDYEKMEQFKNDVHGRRFDIMLDREPDFVYNGRVMFNSAQMVKSFYEMEMTARINPFKYEKKDTVHVENVAGKKEIFLRNTRRPAMPKITVTGDVAVTYGKKRFSFNPGTYQLAELTLYEGLNRMTVEGNGKIEFVYRKGMLA